MTNVAELILAELKKEKKIYIAVLAQKLGVNRATIYYHIVGRNYKGKTYGGSLRNLVRIDKMGNLSLVSIGEGKISTQITKIEKKKKRKMAKEDKIKIIEASLRELEDKKVWSDEDYETYYKLIEAKRKLGLDVEREEEIYRDRVAKKYEQ